jgi:hypothetical protein
MPAGRSKSTRGFKPTFEDFLEAAEYMGRDLGGSIRFTTVVKGPQDGSSRLVTVLQFYQVHDNKAWVLAERTFYWPNNEGRDFTATLQLELHRAYHKWGDLAH